MSSRSKFVQINRSLIVLDPGTMPVNLAQTVREDAPEQSFPALAYDGKDVLPTALGYTSYFGEHTRLNIGDSLKGLKVQHVLQYQSVNMRTLSIALCETGIYIAGSTDGSGSFNWQRVVDFSASFKEGVRRLWTFCVISNRMYMYQQGQDAFYGLVNPAEYMETTIPSAIKDASITQVWYHEASQAGILKYKPNFINMEGQLGIFKAGNRLGFWDSDGAVAWSSATQVYDFVPSTTTFAGITKFSDVVGRITVIHQHGTGFIIYATRSVVVVSALSGSPEKWAGRAIFSDVGVVFDSQVAMAQPDSIHYAITSAGLCRISNGAPEIIETEVMDYVRHNNDIYAVSFIDSRYLFIHVTNTFDSALPEIESRELKDASGNSYWFPLPNIPESDIEDLSDYLNSRLPNVQAEFEEAQIPDQPVVFPSEGEALLPCWEVRTLVTNFGEADIPTNDIVRVKPTDIPSVAFPGNLYEVNLGFTNYAEYLTSPRLANFYYDLNRTGIDVGPEEFLEVLVEESARIAELQGYADRVANRYGNRRNDYPASGFHGIVIPAKPYGATEISPEADINVPVYSSTIHDLIDTLEAKATDCSIQLLGQLVDIDVKDTYRKLSESASPVFSRIEIGLVVGQSGGAGQETVIGNWEVGFGYSRIHNQTKYTYPVDTTSAKMFCAAINKQQVDALNWSSRIGMPLTIVGLQSHISDWFKQCALSTSNPTAGLTTSVIRGVGDNANWVAEPGGGEIWKQGARVAKVLGLGPAPRITIPLQFEIPVPEGWTLSEPRIDGEPRLVALAESSPTDAAQSVNAQVTTVTTAYIEDQPGVDPITVSNVGRRVISGVYIYASASALIVEGNPEATVAEILTSLGPLPTQMESAIRNRILQELANVPWRSEPILTLELTRGKDLSRHPTKTPLLSAEVSGYGYYPYGGFSFRKTHSRSIIKPCGYNSNPRVWNFEDIKDGAGGINIDKVLPGGGNGGGGPKPPFSWDYPETIPLPPNYALFQEGTFAPYYPTYEEAVVLDTQLMKWGRYNNQHKYVYNLFPLNRTDQTIMPTEAGTMRAGALSTDGWCTIFTKENPASTITYGKIGDYRLGWTKATKAVAQFGYASDCYMIVETSINGDTLDVAQSHAIEVVQSRRAEIPFTLAGKWFNIRFQGTFNLVGLSLESEATSRR